MKYEFVSGNVYYQHDFNDYLVVQNPTTSQSIAIHLKHVEPDDLRKFADYLEQKREEHKK